MSIACPLDGPDGQQLPIADHTPITFGVEFEFALATLVRGSRDPHPEDPRVVEVPDIDDGGDQDNDDSDDEDNGPYGVADEAVQRHMVKLLNAPDFFGYAHAIIDADAKLPNRKAEAESYWNISTDFSVWSPDAVPEDYWWHGMEVKTPALLLSPDAIQEVKAVCVKLNESYRINLNNTTSIHIHIGYAKDHFKLQELRKLLTLWWIFEPQFFTLVAEHRQDNPHCGKARTGSRLARRLFREFDLAPSDDDFIGKGARILMKADAATLYDLWNADSRNTFSRRMGPIAHLAIRLQTFVDLSEEGSNDERESKGTVEFRLHEGCLGGDEVANWIQLCAGLVSFTTNVQKDAFLPWLQQHFEANSSVIDILRSMKLGRQADWFEGKLARMAAADQE